MIVTLRAADLQRHEHRADGCRHLGEQVLPPLLLRVDVGHVGPGKAKGRGDSRLRIVGRDLVAGKLQCDESIVGQIGVERVDYPVAVSPRFGAELIVLETVGLGEPRQVEPVLTPPLAVVGRSEQPVDQSFVGVGRVVGDECVDLVRRGGQSHQIERQAADQRDAIGFGQRLQVALRQTLGNEAVDRAARILQVGRHGNGRSRQRRKRPMLSVGVVDFQLVGGGFVE